MGLAALSGTMRRFVGVLLLVPIIVAVWFDAIVASFVIGILAIGMAYEFVKMVTMPNLFKMGLGLLICAQALPVAVFDIGLWWSVSLATLSLLIVIVYSQILVGVFALTLSACLYFTTLLLNEPGGHWLLLMLAAVIAASDTAAYFAGRFIGGPKLAPSISPNKTISGSIGGVIAGAMVMVGAAPFLEMDQISGLQLGIGLAVLSQIGDLFESALKRLVDVKDSGTILPGHGGLLDRFDGYLLALPGFYLFLVLAQGSFS